MDEENQRDERRDEGHHPSTTTERMSPEWAARATGERRLEWSSDRVGDPGDSHDKGERSLCVGEAA